MVVYHNQLRVRMIAVQHYYLHPDKQYWSMAKFSSMCLSPIAVVSMSNSSQNALQSHRLAGMKLVLQVVSCKG